MRQSTFFASPNPSTTNSNIVKNNLADFLSEDSSWYSAMHVNASMMTGRSVNRAHDLGRADESRSEFPLSQQGQSIVTLLACSVLAAIPVWLPSFPPMTDLPQHAAQIALLRNLQDP